ncbi:MAG: LmeA-like phospholipid-binding [Pseudonocardiales bacterium]|jgi:hypothetical protein|nr:LmeA-like phospholipid-binding [Pseudonocardiales bacterium]MDT4946465.1 LmeA-like phospholipid-binding [Pseudonocardiales bacterium]
MNFAAFSMRESRSAGRRRSRLRRTLLISIAALGVLLVTGELIARAVIANKVTHAIRSALAGHVTVGLGGQLAVVDAMTQSIPKVSIHATQVTLCPLKNVAVEATLNDVHRHGNALAVSGSHVQAVLAPQALGAMLGKGGGGGATATVIPDTAQQVLQVRLGMGGLLSLNEKPELVGGAIRFTPVSASIAGLPIPVGSLSQLTGGKAAAAQVTLPRLPLGMTPDGVQVTPGGVAVTASGHAAEAHGTASGGGLGSTNC